MTITVKREHKGRGSERSKISLDYFKVLSGKGSTIEKMDDRDSRIQYDSQFKDWSDPELYGGTEKYADINNSDSSAASEAQATISFTGTGIRIYGLKSLALGRARVTLDGKEMPALDFYTSGATEKRAFIGEFTNLTDGPHTLTLRVDPDSPEGRKKISLDSFDIIKAPAVGIDSPSIAPLKENDKEISLSLPSGDWEAIAVTFPGVKDPLVLRKVDETHLVTSGDQTVLSIQDNQVQIPIPEATDRQTGKAIEAYAIQGTTTSSPVVAVFTKKDEKKVDEKKPTTSKGDEPAPTVDIPEYTDPIGTAGQEEPPTVEKPEYTDPIGTAGEQEAPTVEIPEYTEPIGTTGEQEAPTVEIPEYTDPIGTAGQEEPPTVTIPEYTEPIGTAGQEDAPTVEKPEYTDPIGTSGDQAAPTLTLPDYPVRVLKDKETGVEIIGGVSDLEGISHISSRRVLAQELFGKTYDAYDLQLKNPTDHSLQPKGSVLVRLPISANVEKVYYITPSKELQALDFDVREGKAEFITSHFSTYAVVYQAAGTTPSTDEKPSASDTETLAHEAEQLSASPSLAKTGNHSPKEELPATGEASNPLLFLAGLSLALTATFMLKGRKDESN